MNLLKKKLFNSSSIAFGMDISDHSIKTVELRDNGDEVVVSGFGASAISPGSVVNGDIINRDNVVSAIKQAIERSGPKKIKSKKVICALPETKAFLRIIKIPRMSEDEIGEAIKWEIEANIPLSIDQVYYDWKILGNEFVKENENKLNILVIAVAQKVAEQLIDTVEGAGLSVSGLEVESLAQARSLIRKDEDRKKTTLVVDLGDRVAGFIILLGNTPCFTSNISLSLRSITDSIAKMLGTSIEEAEKIKNEVGIGSFLKQDPVFQAVRPILESLTIEIQNSMDFYLTGLKYSEKIDRILVCGGGANIKGLVPFLSSQLGQDVKIGDPWVNFNQKKNLPIVERKDSAHYSTAIGLALRGLNPYEGIS